MEGRKVFPSTHSRPRKSFAIEQGSALDGEFIDWYSNWMRWVFAVWMFVFIVIGWSREPARSALRRQFWVFKFKYGKVAKRIVETKKHRLWWLLDFYWIQEGTCFDADFKFSNFSGLAFYFDVQIYEKLFIELQVCINLQEKIFILGFLDSWKRLFDIFNKYELSWYFNRLDKFEIFFDVTPTAFLWIYWNLGKQFSKVLWNCNFIEFQIIF